MIVVMVPVRDGKFLMVYNPKRGWEFPGGKVEEGEDPENAVLRECLEEAGLVLKDVKIIENENELIVFKGVVEKIEGGEMKWSWFTKLPENLAFGEEEAKYFLKLAGIYK